MEVDVWDQMGHRVAKGNRFEKWSGKLSCTQKFR